MTAAQNNDQGDERAIPGPRWGKPGSALVPESLRAVLGDVTLPAWVAGEIGRRDGVRVADLDSGVWSTTNAIGPRLRAYLSALVRNDRLRDCPVWSRPWPLGLLPSMLPLGERTANILGRRGLGGDVERLSAMTYDELLQVEEVGPVTLLELACTADAALAIVDDRRAPRPEEVIRELQSYAFRPWAVKIGSRDPRFSTLLPPADGSLRESILALEARANDYPAARALLAAMPALEQKCKEIDALALEDALDDFLAAATGFSHRVRAAVLAHLGWSDEPPVTYDVAAKRAGLSRGQIVSRVSFAHGIFKRMIYAALTGLGPAEPLPYLPAVDRALEMFDDLKPATADEAASMLAARGITHRPFSPESLSRVAEGFQRTLPPALVALLPPRRLRPDSPRKRRQKRSRLRLVWPPRGRRR